ncbi:PspA/IM30 family protein [Halalkalibacter urbisdiaboli]|uniref:PspA/IM30 family protein n=1 Tax=Halalkalibacter urbisdiaboli TaxID=1960589 RepID=UPI000B43BF4F|nr:PspA/IM30 family protein [Halalkalibacter urbisdiaboli]
MAITRIKRLVEATIHEGLEQLEEPVMMVKQYMRDMKKEIEKIEKEILKQEQLHHKLLADQKLATELMERREKQAVIAVEAGEEDLARRALVSKKQAFEQIQRYEGLLQTSEEQLKKYRVYLEQLQEKYVRLRDKIELLLRVQASKASEQMKKVNLNNISRSIEEGFERVEDRVAEMELRTRAHSHEITTTKEIEDELEAIKNNRTQTGIKEKSEV